jgi:ubiquinone/menaquinone biosynthesis C-methylase UbiE
MLRQAVRQAPAAGAHWVLGIAQRLPFADSTFECVTAVLLLHHLTRRQKMLALSEARRVLRPGGELHVADWTKPCGTSALGFLLVRLLDGFGQTADHSRGRLDSLIREAGFERLETLRTRIHALGTIVHLRAEKPKCA